MRKEIYSLRMKNSEENLKPQRSEMIPGSKCLFISKILFD